MPNATGNLFMDPLSRTRADEEIGKVECLRFLLHRVDSCGFECRLQQVWFYDSRLAGGYPLTVHRLVDAEAAWHA